MPPEGRAGTVAAEWLRYARSDLAIAKGPRSPAVLWDSLCFQAQQAAEKAVKAVLVWHRIEFPRTHNIGELLTLLEQAGHPVPDVLRGADRLTDFATVARYPGNPEPADQEDHEDAIRLAEAAVQWAQSVIGRG